MRSQHSDVFFGKVPGSDSGHDLCDKCHIMGQKYIVLEYSVLKLHYKKLKPEFGGITR